MWSRQPRKSSSRQTIRQEQLGGSQNTARMPLQSALHEDFSKRGRAVRGPVSVVNSGGGSYAALQSRSFKIKF